MKPFPTSVSASISPVRSARIFIVFVFIIDISLLELIVCSCAVKEVLSFITLHPLTQLFSIIH